MMGGDNLNLLYQITPYLKYKNFLLAKQNYRCTECGRDLTSLKANEYSLHHEPRLGDKGSKYVDFKGTTRNRVICNECHGKHRNGSSASVKTPVAKPVSESIIPKLIDSSPKSSRTAETKLLSLGYQNIKGKSWVRGNIVVHIEQTKDNKVGSLLIYWREAWKNDYAIVFDYSFSGGLVSIVPIKTLFATDFVSNKRSEGYGNSLNWWSQRFPCEHELAQLVLSHQNRWDLL